MNRQEPLLYRCSLSVRMCQSYANLKASRASRICIDCLFPKLDFSLSDQQIPMFMRLFNLSLALYLGEFSTPSKRDRATKSDSAAAAAAATTSDNNSGGGGGGGAQDDADSQTNSNQSWAGWAWSYVPSVLPAVYWDDESGESGEPSRPSEQQRVVNMTVLVERVSLTCKWTEVVRDGAGICSLLAGPSRMRFQPFLTARMQGCFLSVVLAGVDWVNVQGGVSHLTLEPTSHCLCGSAEDPSFYFLQGCERTAFLHNTLYCDATETIGTPSSSSTTEEERHNVFQWQQHMASVTEATLLERTPAVGFDYLYKVDLDDLGAGADGDGDGNGSELLSQLGSDLEYSNLPERALLRMVVGPLQLKVSHGLCHRLSALQHAVGQYNYPPYTDKGAGVKTGADRHQTMTTQEAVDQVLAMGPDLPFRTYQVPQPLANPQHNNIEN